uniref:Uncharacterized protein n=1 Tax=Oryza glumipatula TaxID=40148 RepID=A0A0E0A444_9ORYZ
MVVPYRARAVLATPARAFILSCPRVWQIRRDVLSFTVRLHRLFGVIFLKDRRDCVTVFVSRADVAVPWMKANQAHECLHVSMPDILHCFSLCVLEESLNNP